jgi:hypothetical protein
MCGSVYLQIVKNIDICVWINQFADFLWTFKSMYPSGFRRFKKATNSMNVLS